MIAKGLCSLLLLVRGDRTTGRGATAAFVALVRLRRWWYVIPAMLVLVAAVRMVCAPTP